MLQTLFRSKVAFILLHQARHKSDKARNILNLNNLLISMPQDKKHIEEAQRQRIRIKEKGARYVPGTVNLQVLGSGAPGSPAAVYLFTDQSRYLFNCGEGTQRLAHEHKAKLARLEHIFMTRTSWERFGGLPGLSLTIQDAGVPNITLHGPQGLDEIFKAMRRFVVLKDLKVESVNCEEGGVYDDQVMTVTYVPIEKCKGYNESIEHSSVSNDRQSSPEIDDTDYYAHENSQSRSNSPNLSANVYYGERTESVVMCYICKLKPRPGALNLEKCVEKGVPPGPLLGKLKNGLDVTLPDGTLVRSDDVRAPTDPGPIFIFIDIPSEEYLNTLIKKNTLFAKHQATAKNNGDIASVVVHFSPEDVVIKPAYQEFVNSFAPSTRHLILNASNKFSGYLAAHRIQWQLNQINEHVFPILQEIPISNQQVINHHKRLKLNPKEENDTEESGEMCSLDIAENTNKKDNGKMLFMDNSNSLTCFHLRPRKGLDRDNEPKINPSEYINETHAIEGFSETLDEVKMELCNRYAKLNESRSKDYPKIIFLGTGSCIPNKTRNVSSILVQTNENSCMILDCGEGTWGQIIRFYGLTKAIDVLRKLKVIYVSHLHADHHIGLIGLLKARQKFFPERTDPVILLAPKQIFSWLYFYNRRIETISTEYTLLPLGDLITTPYANCQTSEMGISSISSCRVHHCPHSFGVSFIINSSTTSDPVKITYSGDTMPCDELVELGKDSTILIHEATMEDELIKEAKIKMHSTVTQAIEQGNKMNAKYILLTHFSQRYAKLPRIENSLGNNIGIAFDNMEVTLGDIDHLNLMYPTLKLMFSEHCDEMEHKALKRALKKERNAQKSRDSTPVR